LQGNDEERTRAEEVLVAVMEAVRIVAVMLSPITPALSSRIYAQLGFSEEQFAAVRWEDAQWGCIPTAHRIRRPQPVFARLEGEFVTEGAPVAAK
jgi:methionyl-tRNA synthetase